MTRWCSSNALISRDPWNGRLLVPVADEGRTFDKQRRVIKRYVDWCRRTPAA
jgi:hypothetical protein